jgi:hypothetical protein
LADASAVALPISRTLSRVSFAVSRILAETGEGEAMLYSIN